MYIVSAYYLALIFAHALAFFLLCPGVLFTIASGSKVSTALYHALIFGVIALVAHTLMFKAFFYNHNCSCDCKCGKCDKTGTKETLCVRTPYMFTSRG
jgi:hypothetical protein